MSLVWPEIIGRAGCLVCYLKKKIRVQPKFVLNFTHKKELQSFYCPISPHYTLWTPTVVSRIAKSDSNSCELAMGGKCISCGLETDIPSLIVRHYPHQLGMHFSCISHNLGDEEGAIGLINSLLGNSSALALLCTS